VKAVFSLFPILAVAAPPVWTGLLLARLLLLTATSVHKPERDKLRILKRKIMFVSVQSKIYASFIETGHWL
jgi:hypothetical protein